MVLRHLPARSSRKFGKCNALLLVSKPQDTRHPSSIHLHPKLKNNMNVNQETGESLPQARSARFKLWMAFLVFSTITMVSAVGVKKTRDESDSNAKWAVTCSVITFVATGVVVILHLIPALASFIVDTKFEGFLTLMLAVFWGATVAVVSNASTGLAVDSELDNTIVNGNLYYFSCKLCVVEIIKFW